MMSASPNPEIARTAAAATLDAARAARASGNAERLVTLCQHALKLDPSLADAWHLLGVQAFELGQVDEALRLLGRAVEAAPQQAEYRNDLGIAFQTLGRLESAEKQFAEASRLSPLSAEIRENWAVCLLRLGRFADALPRLRALAAERPSPAIHVDLGQALAQTGNAAEAVTWLERALGAEPDNGEAASWLGLALAQLGRGDEALARCREGVQRRPEVGALHTNLAEVARTLRLDAEAAAAYRRALELGDGSARVQLGLALALLRLGQHDEAQKAAAEAARLTPGDAFVHLTLGVVEIERGDMQAALSPLLKAAELDPDLRAAHVELAKVYPHLCETEKARHHLQRAIALHDASGLRVRAATLLPAIYASKQELLDYRERYTQAIETLLADGITVENPLAEVAATNFYLAYQGMNDCELQRQYARLYRNLPTEIALSTPARGGRRKVGFISRFFSNHSVAMAFAEVIRALAARDDLEVVLLCPTLAPPPDWTTGRIVRVPVNLELAREVIAREALDILVYADIGMDPFTYFLSFTRLAPVQCVMAGHPVTTGVPAVDYYISAASMEPEGAQLHYTERLVQLAGPPTYMTRPTVDRQAVTRPSPSDATLYVCPMMLQKVHPDFDPAIGEILRRDERGRVIFFRDDRRRWHEPLARRLAAALPDVIDRVHFIEPIPPEQFAGFLSAADVLLDTFHFGAGTTSYIALAAGTPIVTWPSEFMRGRVLLGCLQTLDLDETVARDAEDYVARAVRLGTDRQWQAHVRARIAERADAIFDDRTMIDEVGRFLTTVPLG